MASSTRQRVLVERDLKWAFESPCLVGSPASPLRALWAGNPSAPGRREAFSSPTLDDDTVASLYEQRRAPIGRYFEALIASFLEALVGQGEDLELHRNLAVRSGGLTVGEFDLLLRCGRAWHHIELAVKFYLGVGALDEACNWHGPLARDRLDIKLDTLFGRQMLLTSRAEAHETLKARGLSATDIEHLQVHSHFKGYLFRPADAVHEGAILYPATVNPEALHGVWVRASQLDSLTTAGKRWGWRRLPKSDWLAAVDAEEGTSESLAALVDGHFHVDSRPPMVAAFDRQGRECCRAFVVPDDWSPAATLAR